MSILYIRDEDGNFTPIQTVNGKDGKSAYEIAVEHGFKGSEEEWLNSLVVSSGTTDHNQLSNRNLPDQHPMSAITGLEDALANAGGGGSEQWEKIVDFTTEQEIRTFHITEDLNGNPFDLKECLIVFSAFRTDAEDGTAQALSILLYTHWAEGVTEANAKWSGSNAITLAATADKTYPMNGVIGFKMIDEGKAYINHFALADAGWGCVQMPVASTTLKNNYFTRGVGSDIASKGEKIDSLHLGLGSGGLVGAGSRFVMYGVRK